MGSGVEVARVTDLSAPVDEPFIEKRNKSATTYALLCSVIASLSTILLGYDIGVLSGALIFIQQDLKITQVQEEVLVGCLSILSLIGNLIGGNTSDAFGRKWTIGVGMIVFQLGTALMAFASSFGMLLTGRLFAGMGIGMSGMVTAVYITEISPAVARGSLTCFPEIFINVGILLGYVSNYAFSGLPINLNWRIMLGVGILPSFFIGIGLFIIPESPRWLVLQNRIEEATLVLSKTTETEKEAEDRLKEIKEAAGISDVIKKSEQKAVWRELLCPSPLVRRMLVAGVGIQCFQQMVGMDATVYYSPEIYKAAGVKDTSKLLAITVAMGLCKTVFLIFAIILIDRLGRKPLLYLSTIGMTVCLLGLGVTLTFISQGQVAITLTIALVYANVAFFSVGMGPICWVLTSEVFPLRLRAQAAALGNVGNRVSSGIVSMSFLSLYQAISMGGTFFVFASISALSVVFVYTCVPETKGRSLEQIVLVFQKEHDRRESSVDIDVQRPLL